MSDVFVSFNTAFLLDGNWVFARDRIAQRYLMGWFWVDAPAAIPVEAIELVQAWMLVA